MDLVLNIGLLVCFIGCLGNAILGTAAFKYKTIKLGSDEKLLVQCDHSAQTTAIQVAAMDLWWLSPLNKVQQVASIEDGRVVAYPPFTTKDVYGMQLSMMSLLTLKLEHPTQSQLGGYMCSIRYSTKEGGQRSAIVDYVNFVAKGEMDADSRSRRQDTMPSFW